MGLFVGPVLSSKYEILKGWTDVTGILGVTRVTPAAPFFFKNSEQQHLFFFFKNSEQHLLSGGGADEREK